MRTYKKIYKLVKKIPKGKVATYGQIGQMLNLNPRVVGWALNRLAKYKPSSKKEEEKIPWHRVINSKGGISTDRLINIPLGLQKKLLEKEEVKFSKKNIIDLGVYKVKFCQKLIVLCYFFFYFFTS